MIPSRYSNEVSEILNNVRSSYVGKVVTLVNRIVNGTSQQDMIEKMLIKNAVFGMDHGVGPNVEKDVDETDKDFLDQLKAFTGKNSSIEFFRHIFA